MSSRLKDVCHENLLFYGRRMSWRRGFWGGRTMATMMTQLSVAMEEQKRVAKRAWVTDPVAKSWVNAGQEITIRRKSKSLPSEIDWKTGIQPCCAFHKCCWAHVTVGSVLVSASRHHWSFGPEYSDASVDKDFLGHGTRSGCYGIHSGGTGSWMERFPVERRIIDTRFTRGINHTTGCRWKCILRDFFFSFCSLPRDLGHTRTLLERWTIAKERNKKGAGLSEEVDKSISIASQRDL